MKKMILLLVSGLLIACMAGSAMAKPSIMSINPESIGYNPASLGSAQVIIHDIDWLGSDTAGQHIRVAKVTPQVPNLKARLIVNTGSGLFTTGWADSNTPVSVEYNTAINNYEDLGATGFSTEDRVSYTIEVSGTASGQILVEDKFKTSLSPDPNLGYDYSSASPRANVPEFPTVALPVAGVLGLLFVFGRKKEGL